MRVLIFNIFCMAKQFTPELSQSSAANEFRPVELGDAVKSSGK